MTIPRPRRAHASPLCRGSPPSAGLHRGGGLLVHPPPPTAEQTGDADSAKLAEVGHTVLTMAVGMLGATVKIGGFIPARSHPHPRGASRTSPWAQAGRPFSGDTQEQRPRLHGQPDGTCRRDALLGGSAHLHLDCNDVGIPSVHRVPGMFLPTGVINPIPPARQILTSPVPVPSTPWRHSPANARGVRAFYKKRPGAGGQAAQQGQQDDKEQIPEEHAPQGHLYGHGPPGGRGQRHVLHRRGGLLARRPGAPVMGAHVVQPQRLPGSSGQRVAPRLRHGRRRGHGRGTLTLRMSDGIPVAFPCLQRRNPRSSSPSARRPVWNRTAATAWDMAEDLYYRFTRKEYDSVRLLESVTDCNGLGIRF